MHPRCTLPARSVHHITTSPHHAPPTNITHATALPTRFPHHLHVIPLLVHARPLYDHLVTGAPAWALSSSSGWSSTDRSSTGGTARSRRWCTLTSDARRLMPGAPRLRLTTAPTRCRPRRSRENLTRHLRFHSNSSDVQGHAKQHPIRPGVAPRARPFHHDTAVPRHDAGGATFFAAPGSEGCAQTHEDDLLGGARHELEGAVRPHATTTSTPLPYRSHTAPIPLPRRSHAAGQLESHVATQLESTACR
jgi:hypothetical protein